LSLEGIISKRADAPYSSGDRGLWMKVKCQNREDRGGRLERSRECASLARCAALGVLRPGRAARLCRRCRNRHESGGARWAGAWPMSQLKLTGTRVIEGVASPNGNRAIIHGGMGIEIVLAPSVT